VGSMDTLVTNHWYLCLLMVFVGMFSGSNATLRPLSGIAALSSTKLLQRSRTLFLPLLF
jgi:hypothetical protein